MSKIPAVPGSPADGLRIFMARGKRVILDSELASLYGVTTKRLNQQVRRNAERFPRDFAFLLSSDEWEALRSQIATLKTRRGAHRKFLPYAFTEHGVLMAASVLNSKRAIEVSIYVVRTLVAMREAIANHEELSKRLDELERTLERRLAGHDRAISELLSAIKALMNPPPGKSRPIGFLRPDED
jgi:ATP-dependent Clp protease ATP-binding subunit ClpA